MRRFLLVPILALVAAAAPAAAVAAPDWTSGAPAPAPATAASGSGLLQNGYQTGGGLTQAYLELVSSTPPIDTVLHVRARRPGGAFAEQLRIPTVGGRFPYDFSLAVAPSGAAALGWTEIANADIVDAPRRYRVAYRPAGASAWLAPVTILDDEEGPGPAGDAMEAVIADNGTAAFAVAHAEPNGSPEPSPGQRDRRLDVAVRPAGGAWGAPVRLTQADRSAGGFDAAFDAAGNLTVAYAKRISEGSMTNGGDDQFTIGIRRRFTSNGIFSSEEDLSGSEPAWTAGAPVLGVGPDGSAVVAYNYFREDPQSAHIWGASRSTAAGAFTEPVQLVTGTGNSRPSAAGVAPAGTAYVLTDHAGVASGDDCTGVVRGPAGGAPEAHRCLSPTGQSAGRGAIAFLGDDAVFAWNGSTPGGGDSFLQGTRWPAGAAEPQASRELATPGPFYGLDQVLADGAGSVAVFHRDPETGRRVLAYDGGAPAFSAASVPETAVTGVATELSARAFDLWSPLASGQPTYDFGDGTPPASGPSVLHAYAAAGTYTVTLRAADAFANTRTRTFPVTVTDPPPPQQPPDGGGPPGPGGPTGPVIPPPPPPPPPPAPDLVNPLVKLTSPAKAKRNRRSAWRTLKGTVADPAPSSGIASVEVAVYRTTGRRTFGLEGGRFKRTTTKRARRAFVAARVVAGKWSLKLPKLAPGRYTVLVRARDAAGNRSKAITKRLRLK